MSIAPISAFFIGLLLGVVLTALMYELGRWIGDV